MIHIKNSNIQYSEDNVPAEYYIGLSWDYAYIIYYNHTPVGKVFLVEGEDGSDYGDSDCIYIQWIAMDDGYQGKGYIKGAIQALEKEFPHKKYITAECGDDLLPMYQHLGFEFTGKNPYTFDEMNRIRKAIGKGND